MALLHRSKCLDAKTNGRLDEDIGSELYRDLAGDGEMGQLRRTSAWNEQMIRYGIECHDVSVSAAWKQLSSEIVSASRRLRYCSK